MSSTSPATNATDVAVNSDITATFSENMSAGSVTAATFILVAPGSVAVGGTVSYSGTTATFNPAADLAFSTTYTATITTGAQDAAGNALAANHTWSFTAGAAPAKGAVLTQTLAGAESAVGFTP